MVVKYDEKFDVIDAKDKLIEQMREALENLRKYPATYIESGHQNPILRGDIAKCDAALEAAGRTEK